MMQACQEAGIPLLIHENFRWQSTMRALKGTLNSNVIGQPFRARIQFIHALPIIWENQPALKTLAHLAVADLGSHMLDLARFFFGEPQSLYCQTHYTGPTSWAKMSPW
jgi:predicted dehydrogenase